MNFFILAPRAGARGLRSAYERTKFPDAHPVDRVKVLCWYLFRFREEAVSIEDQQRVVLMTCKCLAPLCRDGLLLYRLVSEEASG